MRLTASLARPPSPSLPMWKRCGNSASSTGAASAAICCVAADKADAVAVPDLLAGAGHRRFEKTQPAGDTRAERRDAVRIAGAGAQHDLAGRGRKQRALDHILDLIGVEHGEHDRLAVVRDVGKRIRRARRFARARSLFAGSTSKPTTENPAAIRRRA